MKTRLLFDTLSYAKMLSSGEVEKSDVHATSLAQVLTQNLYSKDEIDMRFEQTINRFDQSIYRLEQSFSRLEHKVTRQIEEIRYEAEKFRGEIQTALQEREMRFDKSFHELRKEIHDVRVDFAKTMNRYLISTLTILGSLIVSIGALATFAHTFFH